MDVVPDGAAAIGTSVWKHIGISFLAAAKASVLDETVRVDHGAKNRFLLNYAWSVGLIVLAWWFGSWKEIIFCSGYALISVCIVEAIGYLQHYGFSGASLDDELIAWDVNYWLSNRLLANNGRHISHHLRQTQSYCKLAPAHPALPGGYIHMLFLAMLPKMWFRVMNRRLDLVREGARGPWSAWKI